MIRYIQNKLSILLQKGFFHILLGGTLTKVIAFFSSILIVRFVSKSEYAFLAYAENIYSYVYLICSFGLDSAVLKFCVSKDKEKNRGYFFFAVKYGTIANSFVVLLTIIFTCVFPVAFPESKLFLYALVGYPLLYYWLNLTLSYLRAKLFNRQFAYAGIIQTATILVISVALVFSIGAISVVVAKYVAAIIVIFYVLRCIYPELIGERTCLSIKEKKEFVKFALLLLISNVFSMVMPINENFLVNNIIKDAIISANYKVANLIPQQLTFITSAIITFYFPIFAGMDSKKNIWDQSKKVGLLTALVVLFVALIGTLVSPLIIHIAYGDKYSDINYLMNSLWVMHACNAGLRMLPMNILPAVGYVRFNVIMSIVASIFHFIIDYICILNFGIKGAVIAGFFVYIITGFCYWMYLRKKLREG